MMPTNIAAAIAPLPILTVLVLLVGLRLPASRTTPLAFAVTAAAARRGWFIPQQSWDFPSLEQ
ncbi:MAG: hypothetical protein KME20_09630 [Kaiparowitsia implicata GSE-PSE-MK54-09C]|jgi:L-lactate permease|nr:hypothetical protein [Kaiparowitsia implicata GSE-PSE-MK54-09C]